MKKVKRNILLNPGPATTTDTVKESMIVSDICPREEEFIEIVKEVRLGLLKIVKADDEYTCVLFAGSGSAVMDAAINSVIGPEGGVLVINNGAYGERLVRIAEAYSINCRELRFEWGKSVDTALVRSELENDPSLTHVAMVHHETTTGILNPLSEVGAIAHRLDRSFIADTISSYAGLPIDVKKDSVDYILSTSNKCLQAMPGVSFIICKKSDIQKTSEWPARSFYLNLFKEFDYFERNGQVRFTPPVQVIYSMKQALTELFNEGVNARHARYSKSFATLTRGLKELGFELLFEDHPQSRLLTTVMEPGDPVFVE